MSTLPKPFISEERYLELDRAAEYKSEYYDGEMYAMAGAGMAHNQIVLNTGATLHTQLRGKNCQALMSDMRTRIGSAARYAYPDVSVICGKPEVLDRRKDILTNPTVIIEVLSPSTADFDRSFKFVAYTAIPSLRQYVLIATDRISVEVFTRQPDGLWAPPTKATALDETIALESIECRLALADVYDRVEFPAAEASA
jgi:Uma2 family endonuclease